MSDPNRDPDEREDPSRESHGEDSVPETEGEDPDAEVGRTDPFTELEDGEDSPEDPFEEMDDEGESIEDVWETLDERGSKGESTLAPVDDEDALEEDVVDKRSFCQRCRYLSAPPAVECTHDGTEILEVVDSEKFRVRGCPMVERGGPESSTR